MTRKLTLLAFGLLIGLGLSPATSHGADAVPMSVTGLTGSLHVHQNIPCGSVDQTTQVRHINGVDGTDALAALHGECLSVLATTIWH